MGLLSSSDNRPGRISRAISLGSMTEITFKNHFKTEGAVGFCKGSSGSEGKKERAESSNTSHSS